MNKPIILATNIETLEKGQKAGDFEISIGVLPADLKNDNPKLYAYRTGRIYDPSTGFKPAEGNGGHVLPERLQEAYMTMFSEAKQKLNEVKNTLLAGEKNPDKKEENTVEITQLKTLVKSQEQQIKELLESKKETDEMRELKELLQAKTRELEALKAGENKNKEVYHFEFQTIVDILESGFACYLYGPAGTGKSNLAEQIAKYFKLDFYPMSTVTQEFKFTGFVDGHGKYHETNFYKAVKNGGLFFIDEMDSCASDVLVGLNACLANGYFDFPNETVQAHKDFKVVSAGNTIGRGATDEYAGRQALDMSTMDRFLTVKIDYDINIDMAVAQGDEALVNFANALRKASEETEITILVSYRALAVITKLKEKFELSKLMNMAVLKGMAGDDVYMLVQNMNIDRTNQYYKALKKAVA
jgi:cobaltochelatase CobS